MRYSRQNKILDIISKNDVETQEKLAALLRENGYKVTQATVSRDIKELQLVKQLTPDGGYRYTIASPQDAPVSDRFSRIFKQTIRTVTASGNIIVVKTLNGCANAAAEAIDSLNLSHVIGSIAGDNTIFLVIDDPAESPRLMERFYELAGLARGDGAEE